MTEFLQIFMYIFEKLKSEHPLLTDAKSLLVELKKSNISPREIHQLMELLNYLAQHSTQKQIANHPLQTHLGTRIFTSLECQRLNKKCRGLLLTFEQKGILTSVTRELVIDQLVYFNNKQIDEAFIKWTILKVLSGQNDDSIIAHMAAFLLNETPSKEVH